MRAGEEKRREEERRSDVTRLPPTHLGKGRSQTCHRMEHAVPARACAGGGRCSVLVHEAYRRWLEEDERTDDITAVRAATLSTGISIRCPPL